MPDYNKLTVVKLREELVKRGLPKTGLKSVLVDRLREADAQTENQDKASDVPIADANNLQEDSALSNEPSHPSQVRVQDGGEADEKSVLEDAPRSSEPELTEATEIGSLQNPEALDKTPTITAENERVSDAPQPPDLHPAATVHVVAAAAEATPEGQTLVISHMSADAYGANLLGSEVTDAIELVPPTSTGKSSSRGEHGGQSSNQAQGTIQTAIFSKAHGSKSLEKTDGAVAQFTEIQRTIETEVPSQTTDQKPFEEVQEVAQIIEARETLQIIGSSQKLEHKLPEEAVGEVPKVVEEQQDNTLPIDTAMNIDEVQENELTKQIALESGLLPGSASQDSETRPFTPDAELLEDRRKRKRRSQSPPPLAEEVAQKRARTDGSNSSVILPEDTVMQDIANSRAEKSENSGTAHPGLETSPEEAHVNGHPQSSEGKGPDGGETSGPIEGSEASQPLPSSREPESLKSLKPQLDTSEEIPTQRSEDSGPKLSPHDTRFKKLFTGPPKRSASPARQAIYVEHEDRSITPALHPATCALYIRDFMRPLHPSHLKDHLIALATPASTSPSKSPSGSSIITEFYLDPIRTHCLVGFVSIAAASRVRSSLHNRVWPDERTRRPLWVDFVPEEKLQKWIDVEKDVGSQRGQGAKRWEVVYEEEEGGIKAYLQEAGSGPGLSASQSSSRPKTDAVQAPLGVLGAPLGPRIRSTDASRPTQQQKQPLAPPTDIGKGFQALDDLFQSTTAKPKLYYLPVSKAVADKRLDQLEEGKSGSGAGDDMRRYTFKGEVLVDCGAEFPRRVRGGFGGGRRGRGGGGGGGGGGVGYRGEGWRDREREREREEGLRDRARREVWRERDRADSLRERDRPEAWRERDRDAGWRANR